MPSRATGWFVPDKDFEKNLLHWNGSLNQVGEAVRQATNKIAQRTKRLALAEAAQWDARAKALGKDYSKTARKERARAKAMAYSLRKYAELVAPTLQHGAGANYGAVLAGHAAGQEIEWGGTDRVLMAGDERLVYQATSILKRAANG